MLTKPCGREACDRLIRAKNRSILRRRKYCGFACVRIVAHAARVHGQEEAVLRRELQRIQRALGVTGPPPVSLVRVVRRIRANAYRAGWNVVTRKVQRAVARGVLVRQFKPWENVS